MGRLTVILTSPRLPAGLLTATAWRVLHEAAVVATYDVESRLGAALLSDGVPVEAWPAATPVDLMARAQDQHLVWLTGDDGDEELTRALADAVVSRAEPPGADNSISVRPPPPQIEVMVGSFDPPGARLLDLREVMDRLRSECPWDQRQTHESLVRYLVEETYETIEAIETGDRVHLQEELGDLLLQVLFHATIASEHPEEPFDIDDVAAGIVDKLVRRHPHVFADLEVSGVDEVEANWVTIKQAEKARLSPFDGIPPGLPALSLAAKVAARLGRSESANPSTRGDVSEPLKACLSGDLPELSQASLGEALYALAAQAHNAGLDPELALRAWVRGEMDQHSVPAATTGALVTSEPDGTDLSTGPD